MQFFKKKNNSDVELYILMYGENVYLTTVVHELKTLCVCGVCKRKLNGKIRE